MGTSDDHPDIDGLHSRLLNLGLLLNVLVPAMCLCLGGFLRVRGLSLNAGGSLRILFAILIVVSAAEVPAIYLVRRTALSFHEKSPEGPRQMRAEEALFRRSVLVFSLSLLPTVYGLVYYLIGGTFEKFVLLVGITLLCFLIFKPKMEEISSFVKNSPNAQEPEQTF
ncbi:MAG: hypothetical protein WCE90_12275 [Candidatus Zixiibacteriota bacterium]